MDTRQSRRPHLAAVADNLNWQLDRQLQMQLDEYRDRLTALFAGHRHLRSRDGGDTCTCGAAWPCLKEELAAWLIDDWV